ncbi:MAG: DUF2845 domain-containing protein [Acidobacteriota bacterium]|nr:DUF2845 domain-containing protein [Acidobacteriota bacterium]
MLLLFCGQVRADKLSLDERLEIERGLDAEFATMKVILPHSKKPLVFHSDGQYDKNAWTKALDEQGPAARLGDQVQITRVEIQSNKILLEINGGSRSGHWYDHVQVGMGGTTSPINNGNGQGGAGNGSHLALVFPETVPSLKAADIRQILSPIFDFEKHSASEQYVEKLPEPIQKAIKAQKAIEGMDHDQVLLAMGKPRSKSRETNADGDALEDWIYGEPPGKVTFVRFNEGKVVKVEDSYANIGGMTSPPLPSPR